MYDREKSDPAIVAVKLTNKAGQPAAESVEPKGGGRGECESAKHGPGARYPGNRVTGAEAHTARRENIAKRRHAPEVGAVCPNWARTDLCGGRGGNSRPYREPGSFAADAGRGLTYQLMSASLRKRPKCCVVAKCRDVP